MSERFKLEVAPGRRAALLAEPSPLAVVLPGGGESILVKSGNTHPRLREASGFVVAPVGLFHVFTKRKFNARGGGLEFHLLRTTAEAELDDRILSADRIGGAVEQIRQRQAAGKLAMNLG